ncbi:MAG: hypothetical protein M3067_05080 [Chloroflexota bacterium]|nr:hypothetical protein [Chloroflexota bacterium]
MADVRQTYRNDATDTAHYRRASDRAEQRASRAADHGDEAALRIATAQAEALLRKRHEHALALEASGRHGNLGPLERPDAS